MNTPGLKLMATILSISSQVIRGHVGNKAVQFALERLGHVVWAFPTILLSNHPGHPHFAGQKTDVAQLFDMLDALSTNGWLSEIDAVLTGYLPSPEHVHFAAEAVMRIRSHKPNALYLCDPALGDDPKGLYVEERAAQEIRDRLCPLADIITPNRFELQWLSNKPVTSETDAIHAARRLKCSRVLATSTPCEQINRLSNCLLADNHSLRSVVERLADAPHGTGDLMAALFLSHLIRGQDDHQAVGLATASVEAVLQASENSDELCLIESQEAWTKATAWPVETLKPQI